MSTRLSIKQFKELYEIENEDQFMDSIEAWIFDGPVPAICSEGCEVEPDGRCSHGNPSILIQIGIY